MDIEQIFSNWYISYDKLYDDFLFFEKDPFQFDVISGEILAYNIYYKEKEAIPHQSSLIYLRFQCMEVLNNFNTIKFLYGKELQKLKNMNEDCSAIIEGSGYDDLISLQLEIERRLRNETGIVNNPIVKPDKKKGRPKQDIDSSDLTQFETAKLFQALAIAKALPLKTASEFAKDIESITGFYNQGNREALSYSLKLSNNQKKKIVSLLIAAIKEIEDSNI